MWQDPLSKLFKKGRKNLAPFHVRRIEAIVQSPGAEGPGVPARAMLSDFGLKSIQMFCADRLSIGEKVNLNLDLPSPIQLAAKVVFSQELPIDRHIVTSNYFPFRIGFEFIFETPEKEAELKTQYDEVMLTYMSKPKAA